MTRNISIATLCLFFLSSLTFAAAPLQRSSLPVGTAFTDTPQTFTARQTFTSVRLMPSTTPSTLVGGLLYVDALTGKPAIVRNGTLHTLVTEADIRGATMQASSGGVEVGAWSRINFIGMGFEVDLIGDTLLVTSTASSGTGISDLPTGAVVATAGTTAPTGWLFCYGQPVSRTNYSYLFNVIGTIYGVGDGSTTFCVPDLRGRTSFGRDDMGGVDASRLTTSGTGNPGIEGRSLGAYGGADRSTLTTAQLPAHNHSMTYTISGLGIGTLKAAVEGGAGGTYNTANSGSGDAHPQMPPTIVLNYIIKASAAGSGEVTIPTFENLATPTDNTTNNATTEHHGLLQKLSGEVTTFLDGSGGYSIPVFENLTTPTDNTTNNATSGHHGLLPKLSGVQSDVFHGDGSYSPTNRYGDVNLTSGLSLVRIDFSPSMVSPGYAVSLTPTNATTSPPLVMSLERETTGVTVTFCTTSTENVTYTYQTSGY